MRTLGGADASRATEMNLAIINGVRCAGKQLRKSVNYNGLTTSISAT